MIAKTAAFILEAGFQLFHEVQSCIMDVQAYLQSDLSLPSSKKPPLSLSYYQLAFFTPGICPFACRSTERNTANTEFTHITMRTTC